MKKIEPVYMIANGELLIDAPVKTTWVHVMNYPSWQNFPVCEHISGPRGQEGEVVQLRKEEAGFSFPPYYARTLKIDPERRVIWKTYPVKPDEVGFFGIVEFQLYDVQGKTRFVYQTLYEFEVPYETQSELDAFRKAQYDNFEVLTKTIFPKLKKLAEKKGA